MKRNKHSLSHYRLSTFDMGQLVPVACFEVLPGDSVQMATSALVRLSPLATPVMHPCIVRIHHWFVPHRLVWDEWENFITGGKDGLGDGAVFPFLSSGGSGFAEGSLPDYMGIKPGVPDVPISALPIRSYNMIFNEYYRDQDLVDELTEDQLLVQRVAWEKDYFTSARPWPQKGPAVTVPVGSRAPILGLGKLNQTWGTAGQPYYETGGTGTRLFGPVQGISNASNDNVLVVEEDENNPGFPGIYANLAEATGTSILELREAFAIQRYQEARARFGSRYTEYLRYLGVRSSDARLQRPEYLGGGKQTIAFSEVLQTAPSVSAGESTGGVGGLYGHGISAMRSRRFRRFFEEHGLVLTLMSVRPRSMYGDGMAKMWNRRTKEDFWQRELEHIGMQEIENRELWTNGGSGSTDVFGYQDRYAEYRHIQSGVSAEFRDILNDWHLARLFSAQPVLNGTFVSCDPGKRIFQEQTQNSLWVMANHSIQARRMVAKRATGMIF